MNKAVADKDTQKPFQYWENQDMEDIEEALEQELRESENGKVLKLLFMGQRINHDKISQITGDVRQTKYLIGAGMTIISLLLTTLSI